jgi:DNA-binding CsgD family transcriptional regulator
MRPGGGPGTLTGNSFAFRELCREASVSAIYDETTHAAVDTLDPYPTRPHSDPAPPEPDRDEPASASGLTAKELMIVFLMSAGHRATEIAELLELRPRTVENHKRHIYEKLGVGSQSHAVARAMALGLLLPPRRRRPVVGTGHAMLVLLYGSESDCRDQVVRSLVSDDLSFVTIWKREALDAGQWARWYHGSLVILLVDPELQDWPRITSLCAPAVVVRGTTTTTSVPDRLAIADALGHGAAGLVAREDLASDLTPVLSAAANGLFAMSWGYTEVLARWAPTPPPAVPELTVREHDILRSIALGHTIRQTARTLGIATKTVENTQSRLFRKLGAHNRLGALTIADAWGLVTRDPHSD